METPQPRYTKTSDGTHIAYAVMGDGPIDVVYAFGYQSNIDSDGDVVICQEAGALPISKVAEAVVGGNHAYVENAARVLSRTDVNWSAIPGATVAKQD